MSDVPERENAGDAAAEADCSLDELCAACRVEADWVMQLVAHGALDPAGGGAGEWRFTRLSVVHVAKAKRLQRDLGLNMPGVALALDLLAEIEMLRLRLRTFESGR
ncbi:MAG: chaperone modulator CbpM [Hyphomicrobiaceae bacterium]